MKELTPWQKEANSMWLTEMQKLLVDGGVWVWKATGYKYTLSNGKFVSESEEENVALKQILPDNDANI